MTRNSCAGICLRAYPAILSRDLGKIGDAVHRASQLVQEAQAIEPQLLIFDIDRHILKKEIDRRPQRGQGFQRIFKRRLSRAFRPAGISFGVEQIPLDIGADI
jgi:hypothetical protein